MEEKGSASYSELAQNRLKQMEDILLQGADELIEDHKKEQEKARIEITEGQRINARFPGKVNIIARDHSGQVVEINNKADMEYNTMAFRKDVLQPVVEETTKDEFRKNLEFE